MCQLVCSVRLLVIDHNEKPINELPGEPFISSKNVDFWITTTPHAISDYVTNLLQLASDEKVKELEDELRTIISPDNEDQLPNYTNLTFPSSELYQSLVEENNTRGKAWSRKFSNIIHGIVSKLELTLKQEDSILQPRSQHQQYGFPLRELPKIMRLKSINDSVSEIIAVLGREALKLHLTTKNSDVAWGSLSPQEAASEAAIMVKSYRLFEIINYVDKCMYTLENNCVDMAQFHSQKLGIFTAAMLYAANF